ncbi:hypothetical protein RR21198_3717 [Rhodococcus rhodochrous ATCC 21198]|nr:hypothetical protein RR21198_3717 [Rhodococcus rhodochrous ATCC 21198]
MPNGLSFIANWCLTKDYWREDTPSVWAFENIDVEEARQVALEVPQLSPETHGSSYASILKNRYEPWNHIAESEEVKEGVVSKKIVVVGAAKQIILGLNSESRSKMADCLSNELVPPINVTFSRSEGGKTITYTPLSNGWIAATRPEESSERPPGIREKRTILLDLLSPGSALAVL